jgi:CheY-like chemotaxis protein
MEEPSKKNVTILMAEDDDSHATLVSKVLRKAGLDNPILRFKDGQEVLEFLEKINKDPALQQETSYLLLLDIFMPRVDGVEVLRELKTDPVLKNIPVIMLTTSDDPYEIQHCYALGCNLFITKSPDINHYMETLKTLTMLIRVLSVAPLGTGEPAI